MRVATGWLRFLGRLQKPRTEVGTFARQIGAFRQYMQCERGMSPVTIQTRCERLEWFMASLPVQRCALREISVADVDAFLASKGAAGIQVGAKLRSLLSEIGMMNTNGLIAALLVLMPLCSFGAPLMPVENFIPEGREAALLTPEERQQIDRYRRDNNSYTKALLFRANLDALRSDVVEVEVNGKSQRFVAWQRDSFTQDPKTMAIISYGPDYSGPASHIWTGSTSLPAKGRPTARFSWGKLNNYEAFSGQFVIDHVMYAIGTVGRFQVLLFEARQISELPGTEPHYVCVDSTGRIESGVKPVPRCDRPQRLTAPFEDSGPWIPPTLSKAESEPFERLHPKLRISPLRCGPEEITYCEGMVRISCGSAADAPVSYHDNSTGELLGACGYWVRNPTCMPTRWKVCAVKNGVRHIGEEPDPSR